VWGYCNTLWSALGVGRTTFPTPMTGACGIVTPVTSLGSPMGSI